MRWKLAEMYRDIEASRSILYRACATADPFPDPLLAAAAKITVNEMSLRVTSEAIQVHGGYGFTGTSSRFRGFYRGARYGTLGGGTTRETLKDLIGRAGCWPGSTRSRGFWGSGRFDAVPLRRRVVAGARAGRVGDDCARKASSALGYDLLTVPDHLTDLAGADAGDGQRRRGDDIVAAGRHQCAEHVRSAPPDIGRARGGDGRSADRGPAAARTGAGSIRSEYDEAGLTFDPGAVRVARLAEAVSIIKDLLGGKTVTFAGRHYRVTGHKLDFLPVQKPHPPILIGGNGRRLLTLAAREADIVGFSGIDFRDGGAAPPDLSSWRVAAVDERVRLVRETAGPERFARLQLNTLVQRVIVTEDRQWGRRMS